MTTATIDISETMKAFCEQLGIGYKETLMVTFTPTEVTAVVALTNEHGSKYITDDGVLAKETLRFKVTS